MKRILHLLFLLLPLSLWGQGVSDCTAANRVYLAGNASAVQTGCVNAQTTSTSGAVLVIKNSLLTQAPSFNERMTGTPATVSIVIAGCKLTAPNVAPVPSTDTCDSVDTNTTVANAIRAPVLTKTYDYFKATISWTGGTTPSVSIETTLSTARSGGGGSSFTAAGDLSGSATTQEVVGLLSNALPSLSSGNLNWNGSAWNFVAAGSGTVNSGTSGHFAYYASSAAAVSNNAHLDDGATTANTLTYSGSGGFVVNPGSGLAGIFQLAGNTNNPTVNANQAGFIGPSSATFTGYACQLPSTAPSGGQVLSCATPTSGVSVGTWVSPGSGAFPLTVSGTVNSGGIPYFNSTTQESSSALLTSNVLVKGGGAGTAPSNSSVTDNATAVTTTDTGGYVAPVFVSNGSTAGFLDLPQGSTSTGVAPCTAATSICIQAPTAVTSYNITLAGTAATGLPHYANSSNAITETISAVNLASADITGLLPLSHLSGSAASTTATEVAAGDYFILAGVETAALTYPYVITDANSTGNNTSGALIVQTTGTSTAAVPAVINEATAAGPFLNMYSGGTVTGGVLSGGTLDFSFPNGGYLQSLLGYEGLTAAQAVVVQSGTDGNQNAAFGTLSIRGANETGAGGASTVAGELALQGGANSATNATSQAGSVQLGPGQSTGATQGLQGLLLQELAYIKGTTVTQWNLQSASAAMTTADAAASPSTLIGVAQKVNTNSVLVVQDGETPVNASAAVTLGHTVCAGTTASKVTDSGGTNACPPGQITVGTVMATSGAWKLPDATAITASTTLPIIQLGTLSTAFGGAYNSGSISASVGATNVAAAANFPTGQYLLNCDVVVTAVGTSPTLAVTIGWTDISGTARTKTCTTGVATISDNPVTQVITSNGSAVITVTQTLAVSTATWQTTVSVLRLQ